MALVPYAACIFSAAPGYGWRTEDAGPNAGLPVLTPAWSPASGSGTATFAATTPPAPAPATGIPTATPVVLATATVTSPPALFAARAVVRANVPPFAVKIENPRVLQAFCELRVSYTIGATSTVASPARGQSHDTVREGQKYGTWDLGDWESLPGDVAIGQTVTATASLVVWGTFASGADFGTYGNGSLLVEWRMVP